jgi:hypothetical protein
VDSSTKARRLLALCSVWACLGLLIWLTKVKHWDAPVPMLASFVRYHGADAAAVVLAAIVVWTCGGMVAWSWQRCGRRRRNSRSWLMTLGRSCAVLAACLSQWFLELEQRHGGWLRARKHPSSLADRIVNLIAHNQGTQYDKVDMLTIAVAGVIVAVLVVLKRLPAFGRPTTPVDGANRRGWVRRASVVLLVPLILLGTMGAKDDMSSNDAAAQGSGSSWCSAGDQKSAQRYAFNLAEAKYGWSGHQLHDLRTLWMNESTWCWNAANPKGPAYGIPQADPGDKMSKFGSDWKSNPHTQIRWGLWYIRYGTSYFHDPSGALEWWNQTKCRGGPPCYKGHWY